MVSEGSWVFDFGLRLKFLLTISGISLVAIADSTL